MARLGVLREQQKETGILGSPRQLGCAADDRHLTVLPFSRSEAWKRQSLESRGLEDEA